MECLHCLAYDPDTESCTLSSTDVDFACPMSEIDLILSIETDEDIIE